MRIGTGVVLAALALGTACRAAPAMEVEPARLRLVAYNVKHGRGMDDRVDPARAARVLRALDPDLVALQEIDQHCTRSGGVDQAAWFGQELGLAHAFGAFMKYDGGRYGMAVLSKLPIVAVENHALPPGPEPRTALAVRVRLEGDRELVFVGVHLYATAAERLAQARQLVALFANEPAPVVLIGDFNSEPGSPPMRLLTEHWHAVDKGADRLTFDSVTPSVEIDHVLLRPAARFRVLRADVLDEPLASDHRPVVVDVALD